MTLRAKIGEGVERKVVAFIPRSGIREVVRKEAQRAGLLGCRCPDYVLEAKLAELHNFRKDRIISSEEFNEMYFGMVNEAVNAPQNQEYAHDFQTLMERHQKYWGALSVGEQVEEIYSLREKYGPN